MATFLSLGLTSQAQALVFMTASPRSDNTGGPELVKRIPIYASNPQRKTVVTIPPDNMPPSLQAGDRLNVRAEVEVSHEVIDYDFAPDVKAWVFLADDRDDVSTTDAGTQLLGNEKSLTCTKAEHHCMFVWDDLNEQPNNLACKNAGRPGDCRINIVMSATNPNSNDMDDEVIIGQNSGSGHDTSHDNARIGLVRLRGGNTPNTQSPNLSGPKNVPVQGGTRTVVASQPFGNVGEGAQFQVAFTGTSNTNGHNRMRTSSEIILGTSPTDTSQYPGAQSVAGPGGVQAGTVTPFNGYNCTGGTCNLRKAGVIRKTAGGSTDLYVNVLAVAEDPDGPETGNIQISNRDLKVTKYNDSDRG